MTTRSRICSIAGTAIAGLLAFGATGASAQAIFVDSYVDPYPAAVVPGSVYVAPPPVVAAPPIVRPGTVVVSRRTYVPAPAFAAPVPFDDAPFGYTTAIGYSVSDW